MANWAKRRARLLALVQYIGYATFLLALPLLVAEGYAAWRGNPYTVKETITAEFREMPAAYRGREHFTRSGAVPAQWDMACYRLPRTAPAAHPIYRCLNSRIMPNGMRLDPYILFPPESGWSILKPTYTVDHLAPVSSAVDLWATGLAILLAVAIFRRLPARVPERRASILIAGGVSVLLLLVVEVAAWVVTPWATETDWQVMGMLSGDLEHALLPTFLSVVVLGPALEEIVFRGIGWRLLVGAFPLWATVAVTTATFTAVHPGNSPAVLFLIALSGLSLAVVRIVTGSLAWCIALHGAMNAINLFGLSDFRQ